MSELYHYGIKRRSGRYKWGSGERPYQSATKSEIKRLEKGKERPEIFRNEHIVSKGTTVYLINKNTGVNKKSDTVSYLNIDRDRSINLNSLDKRSKTGQTKMVLTEDIKVPSRDHLKEVIDSEISKNPKLLDSAIHSIIKDEYLNVKSESIKDDSYYNKLFNQTMKGLNNQPLEIRFTSIVSSFDDDNDLKKTVFKTLSNEGYNGIVDESRLRYLGSSGKYNVIQYQKGADPIMVFDLEKSAQVVNQRYITEDEEKKSRNNSRKWLTEKGRLRGSRTEW